MNFSNHAAIEVLENLADISSFQNYIFKSLSFGFSGACPTLQPLCAGTWPQGHSDRSPAMTSQDQFIATCNSALRLRPFQEQKPRVLRRGMQRLKASLHSWLCFPNLNQDIDGCACLGKYNLFGTLERSIDTEQEPPFLWNPILQTDMLTVQTGVERRNPPVPSTPRPWALTSCTRQRSRFPLRECSAAWQSDSPGCLMWTSL